MRTALLLTVAVLLTGCSRRVEVSLPATPAVEIRTDRVAVVSGERACRDVADQLVEQLNDLDGIAVDPRADVRLVVRSCESTFEPKVDITVPGNDDEAWASRVSVAGRAVAVLQVEAHGQVQVHLIGTGVHESAGELRAGQVVRLRRRVARDLAVAVAVDLTEQVRPIPRIVQRRVYPNAPASTARGQRRLAVEAELAGDLHAATRHARMSHQLKPSAESAEYLQELERILRQSESND